MQNDHRFQQVYTERIFNITNSLFLSNLKLQFSDRHNSLYGYGDFLARLFDMCRHGQYAETAYNSGFIKDTKNQCKRTPCGTWMLGVIKQVRYDYMLTRCLKIADRTVMMMKRHGMLRMPVDVAIDKHAIPRYDKTYNMLNIITSKFKSGTYHFNCLATINCTVKGSRAFLGATLVRRMDSLSDTVSKLIDGCTKKGIRIGMLAVYREFFSTGVIGTLKSKNVQSLCLQRRQKASKRPQASLRQAKQMQSRNTS